MLTYHLLVAVFIVLHFSSYNKTALSGIFFKDPSILFPKYIAVKLINNIMTNKKIFFFI